MTERSTAAVSSSCVGGRERFVGERTLEGVEEDGGDVVLASGEAVANQFARRAQHQFLHSLPAVEGIGVAGGEEREIVERIVVAKANGRGEAPVEARHGRGREAREDPFVTRFGEFKGRLEFHDALGRFETKRTFLAVAVKEGDGEGH